MCIIIAKPKNCVVPERHLETSFLRNPDGAGIAYVDEGQVVVEKGFFTLKAYMKAIKKIEGKDAIIHCRLQTHGGKDKVNCHPFEVKSKAAPDIQYAIAHNGQLPWRSSAEHSDTHHFIYEFIQPLLDDDPGFFNSIQKRLLMEKFITERNKLAVLMFDRASGDSKIYICNPYLGTIIKDVWYSNYSYMPDSFNRITGELEYTGNFYGHRDYWERGPSRNPMLPLPLNSAKGEMMTGHGSGTHIPSRSDTPALNGKRAWETGGWFVNQFKQWVCNNKGYAGAQPAMPWHVHYNKTAHGPNGLDRSLDVDPKLTHGKGEDDSPSDLAEGVVINVSREQMNAIIHDGTLSIATLSAEQRKICKECSMQLCTNILSMVSHVNTETMIALGIEEARNTFPNLKYKSDADVLGWMIISSDESINIK